MKLTSQAYEVNILFRAILVGQPRGQEACSRLHFGHHFQDIKQTAFFHFPASINTA